MSRRWSTSLGNMGSINDEIGFDPGGEMVHQGFADPILLDLGMILKDGAVIALKQGYYPELSEKI